MKLYSALLFIVLFNASFFAQKDDAKNFYKVGKDIFSVPTRFDNQDWKNFSATIGVSSACFLLDRQAKDFTQNNKSPFLDGLCQADKYYHVEFISVSIAVIYGYGLAAKKDDTRKLGLRLAESTVYAALINGAAKFLLGRERPYMTDDNMSFNPLNFSFNSTSLPSGHTTLAFAYSTVMADEYNNFFWKFAWYSAASLVGFSRMYHNAHWLSDVVLGGAIGYFVGDFVDRHKSNNPDKNKKNYSVAFNIEF